MRRINPRLGPCELSDLMSDSGNWDLLAQIHNHPSTWPELDQWAAHAIADPETAGAPPEPLAGRRPKHRLLPITPIIDDELSCDMRDNSNRHASKIDKRTGTTVGMPMENGERVKNDASFADDSSADGTDEIAVYRHIPFARIAGIMLALVTTAGLVAGLVMAKKNYDHQEALTSCNQAIKQTSTVRIEWNKALKQAEPYAKLQDKDVQDPNSLELLSKIMQYQPSASTKNCDPSLTADRLDLNRAETEKANNQLRIQIRNLHDAVDAVKASQEQQQIDNAQSLLSQTIEDADRLYKESENKVRDDGTRARLNEQITRARLMMRDHCDLDVYNETIQDLSEVMQIVRDSMMTVGNEYISDADRSDESTQPGSDSQASNQQPTPSLEDLFPPVMQGDPTWDVPRQSTIPLFPQSIAPVPPVERREIAWRYTQNFRPVSLDSVGFEDGGGRPADLVAIEAGTAVAQTAKSTVSAAQIGNANFPSQYMRFLSSIDDKNRIYASNLIFSI